MPYEVEKMSPTTLHKILLVLEDIKLTGELHNRKRFLLYRFGELAGVTKDEQETILSRLTKDGVIGETPWVSLLTKYFLLRINDSFFDFYDQVKLKLRLTNKEEQNEKLVSHTLSYDLEKSILYFGGHIIEIRKRNEKPNAHYILQHLFTAEDGLNQQYSYWEIAEDTFKSLFKISPALYTGCENL